VVIAGFLYRISSTEWLTIILCISLVIGMEAMNTAVEWLTDLVSPEYHPLAGKVKDVAAAAVLITVIGAVVAGLIIFIPRMLYLSVLVFIVSFDPDDVEVMPLFPAVFDEIFPVLDQQRSHQAPAAYFLR
jgi:hypothetical protein